MNSLELPFELREPKTDRDLEELRSGYDRYSDLSYDQLSTLVGNDRYAFIVCKEFKATKYRNSALRWILRGLTLQESIRKVWLDYRREQKRKQPETIETITEKLEQLLNV